jgi:acetyltransferase-like isoleucine patch superfamily enzyme
VVAEAGISGRAVVAPGAEIGPGAVVAPGAVIHDGARVGARASVGSGTVVHAEVQVGENCTVEDLVVLGKRPRLRRGSSAASGGRLAALVVEDRVTVCCGAVVYAGSRIRSEAIIGDQAQVRERSEVGRGSVVGRASSVDFDVRIGANVLIQTMVYLTGGSIVEDEVFLGPGVVTTNDHAMGRHPRAVPLRGPTFRRACRVGGGAVILPGIEIGEEAFIAAGAVVTRDVAPRQVVIGVPGRVVREVSDEDLIERWR